MITDPVLIAALRRSWDPGDARITAHRGGMGSQTWFADQGDRRWVAKVVARETARGSPIPAAT